MLLKNVLNVLNKLFSKPSLEDHFASFVEFQVFEASYITGVLNGFSSHDKVEAYKWTKHLENVMLDSSGPNWKIHLIKIMIDQINRDNDIKSLSDYYDARNKLLKELYPDEPFLRNPFLEIKKTK